MAAVRPMQILARPVDVSQGWSNVAVPSLGSSALIFPQPLGYAVRPNPVTLAEATQVWGFRRELWSKYSGGFAGTNDANGSWWQPVSMVRRFETTVSGGACVFHFHFDGAAFEVLFEGNVASAVLIVDGCYATPQSIGHEWRGGAQGAQLTGYDTYLRFDFGSAAARNVSLYAYSTLGPGAFAIGARDTLSAWDRSGEPTMTVQADSYGAALSPNWAFAGIFSEAAVRLGITHLDVDAVGGTGYAANNIQTRAGDAFSGRLATMTRYPCEVFLTCGGINDNNWLALPPYASGADARAGFDGTVQRYFRELRAALPQTVLAAVGPWQPNPNFYPQSALDKADTIRAALQAVAGPWVFMDNLRGGWLASSGASGPPTGAWQTGTGNVVHPKGDGNGDLYVSGDGTHPSEAGCTYLGEQIASNLRAAFATL
jgi:hypothetical protein